MRERAEMLHGTLHLESCEGQGTCIYTTIPTQVQDAENDPSDQFENWRSNRDAAAGQPGKGAPDLRLFEAAEVVRAKELSIVCCKRLWIMSPSTPRRIALKSA
jgi:hypothetical protein